MWEQGEGCSAFRVHEDVYKEMPHHVVGSTSWVVTGFFIDVLGSSMAWINFCHSKLPSWIQNIPELCTRDSALATTCIQSLLSCWSVQLSLASVPIFSSVSLSLVQIESAFFLAVLKGCRKFCVERSLVLLWAGKNSSLCASLHIWIISNPHTDTALHRPVSSSSTQPCKSKPKAFIENFDTYICISKQVFRAVWNHYLQAAERFVPLLTWPSFPTICSGRGSGVQAGKSIHLPHSPPWATSIFPCREPFHTCFQHWKSGGNVI